MSRAFGAVAVISLGAVLNVAASTGASAHNRAHLILPTGECLVVGVREVRDPAGRIQHDLRPETYPADELGTAYAADEGSSFLLKGECP